MGVIVLVVFTAIECSQEIIFFKCHKNEMLTVHNAFTLSSYVKSTSHNKHCKKKDDV